MQPCPSVSHGQPYLSVLYIKLWLHPDVPFRPCASWLAGSCPLSLFSEGSGLRVGGMPEFSPCPSTQMWNYVSLSPYKTMLSPSTIRSKHVSFTVCTRVNVLIILMCFWITFSKDSLRLDWSGLIVLMARVPFVLSFFALYCHSEQFIFYANIIR